MPERMYFHLATEVLTFQPICNTKLNGHTFDVTAKLLSNVTSIVEHNVAQLMTCPFTGPKIVCAGPNVLCQTKICLDIVQSQTFCARTKDDLCLVNSV